MINYSSKRSFYLFLLTFVLLFSCKKDEALFKNKAAEDIFAKIQGRWKVISYSRHYIIHRSAGWMGFYTCDDSEILLNDTLTITDDNYLAPDTITKAKAYYEFNFYQFHKKELRYAINRYRYQFFPVAEDKTYYSLETENWEDVNENTIFLNINGLVHIMSVNGNRMTLHYYWEQGFIETTQHSSYYVLEKIN